MVYLYTTIQTLSKWSDKLAQVAMVIMLLIVAGNVLLRIVWEPFIGTIDIASFLGAVVISFALANCAVQNGYAAVGIVIERLSQRTQVIVDSINSIISIGLFAVIGWQCAVYASELRQSGVLSVTIMVPFYPFVYGVSFGCIMLSIVLFVGLLKSAAKGVKN